MNRVYSIIKCNNCKKLVISSAKKYFKCSYCLKNQDISKKKIYFSSDNPLIVKEVLIKINKEVNNNELNFIRSDFLL